MKKRVSSILIALLALEPWITLPAQAKGGRFLGSLIGGAGRAAARSVGGTAIKSYGPNVLTVEQLKTCLTKAATLDKDSESLSTEQVRLSAAKTELEAGERELEQKKAKLNRSRKSEVDRYNKDITAYNTRLQNLKADQAAYNTKVDNHNAGIADFNGNCTKSYYKDDMDLARTSLKLD
ncbi:hypothetical protein [Bosea sp. CS1GBMeth4]|uniref:hypothetical protein n=1 Tax=Bosea sp. CS1GBMeth4 TaxID=1892849 RepID=UPI00164419CF|nr:hypothetical protein [Bosea sp. CS1GBMeth4]